MKLHTKTKKRCGVLAAFGGQRLKVCKKGKAYFYKKRELL
jgi:hypothetical protein